MFSKKIIFIFIFANALSLSTLNAWWPLGNQSSSCAAYECSCIPLHCGAFDLQLHAGVCPTIWLHRSPLRSGVNPFPSAQSTIFAFDDFKFTTLYKLPWTVGGQLGYAWSDQVRFYIEGNYVRAHHKKDFTITTITNPPFLNTFFGEDYTLFDCYLGGRYYGQRWCNRIAWFAGGKLGMVHYKKVHATINVGVPTPTATISQIQLIDKRNVISGGAHFGVDVCFCGNWALVITAEIVASAGPRFDQENTLNPILFDRFTSISFSPLSAELRFPITVGIRYSF